MTFHYIVANFGGAILGVYGSALRELAFEKAAEIRKEFPCEVFTRSGKRLSVGQQLTHSI